MALMFSVLLMLITIAAHGIMCFLMYPRDATQLSLISSLSVPVSEYFPERRILIDWCFVMSYGLPSSPAQFYNIPTWPLNLIRRPGKRELHGDFNLVNETHAHLYEKYASAALNDRRHPNDFSAGELYKNIEDFLVTYGFHQTCLLRAVCELARHPFDDRQQNIVTDIVTFFLTPSLHEAFDRTEQIYREIYEDAETRGFYGGNCAKLYLDCKKDLLTIVTKVMFSNE